MTKGQLRRMRKDAAHAGREWSVIQENGMLRIVQPRTRRAEHRHAAAMDRWARQYDRLNGAPENNEDR